MTLKGDKSVDQSEVLFKPERNKTTMYGLIAYIAVVTVTVVFLTFRPTKTTRSEKLEKLEKEPNLVDGQARPTFS